MSGVGASPGVQPVAGRRSATRRVDGQARCAGPTRANSAVAYRLALVAERRPATVKPPLNHSAPARPSPVRPRGRRLLLQTRAPRRFEAVHRRDPPPHLRQHAHRDLLPQRPAVLTAPSSRYSRRDLELPRDCVLPAARPTGATSITYALARWRRDNPENAGCSAKHTKVHHASVNETPTADGTPTAPTAPRSSSPHRCEPDPRTSQPAKACSKACSSSGVAGPLNPQPLTTPSVAVTR